MYISVGVDSYFGPVLFGPNDLQMVFWVLSQRLNSATSDQKESLDHYTDSEPDSRLPNS